MRFSKNMVFKLTAFLLSMAAHQCKICKRKFTKLSNLKRYMVTHEPNSSSNISL